MAARGYTLNASFPPKVLEDESLTLKDAGQRLSSEPPTPKRSSVTRSPDPRAHRPRSKALQVPREFARALRRKGAEPWSPRRRAVRVAPLQAPRWSGCPSCRVRCPALRHGVGRQGMRGRCLGQASRCSCKVDEVHRRFMIHSGQPVRDFVDEAVRHVLMKQGVLGIKVKIMHGWDASHSGVGKPFPLPDAVTILEPKEEAPITAPVSESRQAPAAPIGGVAPGQALPGQPDVPAQAQQRRPSAQRKRPTCRSQAKTPFALLGDEDGPAPAGAAAAAPASAKQADAAPVKRNIPGAGGNNANNGTGRQQANARGANSAGRGGARSSRQTEAGAGAGGDEESPAQRDGRSGFRPGSCWFASAVYSSSFFTICTGNRGRGAEARGGRGRGAGGRGRGRQFDRHSRRARQALLGRSCSGRGKRWDAPAEGGAKTGDAPSAPLAAVEEEKDNTKTLDEYLAEQAAKRAQIGAKKEARQADNIDASSLGKKVEHSRGEDFYSVQKEMKHRQRERKEKATLEIEQTFYTPPVRPSPGRGGARGGGRGGRGGERGAERGGRGRGAARGGRGGRPTGPAVNLADQSAFPTLGN
ncbi:hypothetical protein L7F22_064300 [Adiantum nelumboides]|nr:hypothetical protein [Adiantum nelumboides]